MKSLLYIVTAAVLVACSTKGEGEEGFDASYPYEDAGMEPQDEWDPREDSQREPSEDAGDEDPTETHSDAGAPSEDPVTDAGSPSENKTRDSGTPSENDTLDSGTPSENDEEDSGTPSENGMEDSGTPSEDDDTEDAGTADEDDDSELDSGTPDEGDPIADAGNGDTGYEDGGTDDQTPECECEFGKCCDGCNLKTAGTVCAVEPFGETRCEEEDGEVGLVTEYRVKTCNGESPWCKSGTWDSSGSERTVCEQSCDDWKGPPAMCENGCISGHNFSDNPFLGRFRAQCVGDCPVLNKIGNFLYKTGCSLEE